MEGSFSTIGREIYPGQEVKLCCFRETDYLENKCDQIRFRIIYLKEGHGIFQNGDKSQIITSPTVICLNQNDEVSIHQDTDLVMDVLYFDPFCYGRYYEYKDFQDWKDKLGEDWYFFRAFFERTDSYIGAVPTTYAMGNQVSRLITLTDEELSHQKDDFWPCRSRSFFIELLLKVNSIYVGDMTQEKVFNGNVSEDVLKIIDWVNSHYLEKLTLEDITKQFHTNKTTLNQKFKKAMGITVMEYIINLRMQMACSLLRRTYLSVSEILERSGYHDDAHFLRAFKKYTGCTPTEYRNQFED